MKDLFLFVRPPRPLWPFNGAGSAFWPPLAFASMASVLREQIPTLDVAIIDCPAEQMGWRSLEALLRRLRPSYVGIGEEAVSCMEGLRAAKLAKALGAEVIAGGCFFGNLASETLTTGVIDIVVHGEGEVTIVELVRALQSGDCTGLRDVSGISFRDKSGELVFTGYREPFSDLDALPMPAYDLLPIDAYGRGSHNHPAFAAIEFGRGCPHRCSFCVLWRQMGHHASGSVSPCLRMKSPERALEEITILRNRYRRRYLGWVDPCFNAHSEAPRRLAEMMLQRGIAMGQSAWVRADHLRRDMQSGALVASIRSGLNEMYIGIERPANPDLRSLQKDADAEQISDTLRELGERYPGVSTVGSFIYGINGDSPELMRAFVKAAFSIPLDLYFFIPLTPLPGTPYWDPNMWDGTGQQARRLNFLPGSSTELTAPVARALLFAAAFYWPAVRVRNTFKTLFVSDLRRRSVARRHFFRAMSFVVRAALTGTNPLQSGMRIPAWYEG